MADYKVGYRKPPVSGQIKKGEVRNPAGRRGKKQSAPGKDTEGALLERIDAEVVTINGQRMTCREATVRAQYANALAGKAAAIRYIDTLLQRNHATIRVGGLIRAPSPNFEKIDTEAAIDRHLRQQHRERARDRRRRRRARERSSEKRSLPLEAEWVILGDLEDETIVRDGQRVTMREVRLRRYRSLAAKGNRAAQQSLNRVQDAVADARENPPGYLILPELMSFEAWSEAAAKQQAKYREKSYSEGHDPDADL